MLFYEYFINSKPYFTNFLNFQKKNNLKKKLKKEKIKKLKN